jgi:conjugal transfer pilus assembly protein TraB
MLKEIKNQQYALLLGLIAILSVALIVTLTLAFNPKKHTVTSSAPKQLTTGASRANPQELWVHDFTAKAMVANKRLDLMEQALNNLLKLNKEPAAVVKEPVAVVTETSVDNLKNDLKRVQQFQEVQDLPLADPIAPIASFSEQSPAVKFRSHELKKISLTSGKNKTLKTVDNTIPAGAFAQGMLLGGVDASTSIQASGDPRPILLRLTHKGTLPRRFHSDLEGCHALAAAYGDISSERVFMRLEKLSCVERKTGEVIDVAINGYVAGEDGRAGVRGLVVDRAGESMRQAMVGGFFSSVGKFLGQAKAPVLFSPATGLSQTPQLDAADIFKQSAASGMGGALDKYADFYIKRAEQMQPVIQVAAGRQVDLVFTKGLNFADSHLRQNLSQLNDQKRYQEVQNQVNGAFDD